MFAIFLMHESGNEDYVEVHDLKAKYPIRSQKNFWLNKWSVVEIHDSETGYEFYVSDTIEDVEYFISKWSEMDIWEKVAFIGYYDNVNGDILTALKHYNEYDLFMGKDGKTFMIY